MWDQFISDSAVALLTIFTLAHAAPASPDFTSEDDLATSLTSSHAVVAVILCLIVVVLLLVLVVPGCMDCMNSEVSSESHPACGETTHKWGGAAGYSRANQSDPSAGFRSGERVNPDDNLNQPLPYSMVPTHVPEDAGFRGYQSGGDGSGQGFGNYGGQTAYNPGGGLGGDGGGRPTHYQPVEPEEPPPPYGAAISEAQ